MQPRSGGIALGIALALGLTVLTAPGFGLLAALAILIVAGVFLLPRVALAVFALFLVLQPATVNLAGGRDSALGDALQRVDEIILLAGVLRVGLSIGAGRMRRNWRWISLTAAFVLAGTISGIAQHVSFTTIALGAFLAIKFPLFFLTGLTVPWTRDDARRIVKTAVMAPPIIVALALLLWLAPNAIQSVFIDPAAALEEGFARGGMTAMTAPFSHPGQLGWALAFCGCFAVAALSARAVGAAASGTSLGASLFGILASLRRKPLLGLPLAVLVGFGAGLKRKQRMYALSGTAVLLALLALAARSRVDAIVADTTANYLDPYSPTAARTMLYVTGWDIGARKFPLGAGFGRFGGYISQIRYSPVYDEYGLSTTYGLSPDAPYYIQDTYWPHILGEAGWIGIAIVAGLLVLLWRAAMQVWTRETDPWLRALAFGAAMALVEVILESAAAPVFEGTLFAYVTALPLAAALVISRNSERGELTSDASVPAEANAVNQRDNQ